MTRQPPISVDECVAWMERGLANRSVFGPEPVAILAHLQTLASPEYREMERAAEDLVRIDHERGGAGPMLAEAEWKVRSAALAFGRSLLSQDKTDGGDRG